MYGTIDIDNTTRNLTEAGSMRSSDVTIWLKSRLDYETNGTVIDPQIRPAINDHIIWDGVTYRISKIIIYKIGDTEIFAKVFGMRMKSDSPTVDWNDSYDSTYKIGGGYS